MHFWGTKWSEEVYSAGILKYTVEAYKSIQSILKQHHSLAIWQMDTRSNIGFMCLWCPACVVTDHNNNVYISFLRNTQRSHIQDIRKYSAFTLLILLACTLSWWSNTRITHDKHHKVESQLFPVCRRSTEWTQLFNPQSRRRCLPETEQSVMLLSVNFLPALATCASNNHHWLAGPRLVLPENVEFGG